MRFIKSVIHIINYKTLLVTTIAVISTWFCIQKSIFAEFPLTIVGISIVFPIVFSINSAYRRRERALIALADATGNAMGIYQIAKNQMENPDEVLLEELRTKLVHLFVCLKQFLVAPKENMEQNEDKIFEAIGDVSSHFKELRKNGLAGRFISRLSQYITQIAVSIDNMKVIYNYRTPRTLRAYSKIFIYSFPVLYAPYFALTAINFEPHLSYFMPVLFSFILVSLDNIQEHLENPYDQIGEDDITVNINEIERMLGK